jgi:UDPglucose 6-dehydrogenase
MRAFDRLFDERDRQALAIATASDETVLDVCRDFDDSPSEIANYVREMLLSGLTTHPEQRFSRENSSTLKHKVHNVRPSISVIGLGKLGAVMAGVMAERGHTVVGVDINPATVDAINAGRAPVSEPGLDEIIAKNGTRLTATGDITAAIKASDITFIVVPTPSGPDGTFTVKYVLNAIEAIAAALRQKSDYHLVVVSSTVMPGQTQDVVLPALERVSGKKVGREIGLCYNPEFIALGSVIRDVMEPDMILIGESDHRAGSMLEALYRTVCSNDPPVARMNLVNAELTKISVITYVTTKISYANMLAEICERVPGADSNVVGAAIGLDKRIGREYLRGAFGYGGPCFPRDNVAFAKFAEMQNVDATMAKAAHTVNKKQAPRLAERVLAVLPEGGTVGILGLSYKPDTEVIEASQSIMLAKRLLQEGCKVIVFDPVAMTNAKAALGASVSYASSVEDCAKQASVVVIATSWKQFEQLEPSHLNFSLGRPTVVDWCGMLSATKFSAVANYITCGQGPTEPPRLALFTHVEK